MRKPISKQAAKQQIKLLTKYSPDDQLKIINKSISGDYQGLFDLKPYELTSCGHNGQHKAAQSATSSPMRRIVDVMRDQNAE